MRVLTGKWSEGVRGMTVVIPISEGALGASCVSAVEAGVRYGQDSVFFYLDIRADKDVVDAGGGVAVGAVVVECSVKLVDL